MLAHVLLIAYRERENIVEIDAAVHIIDVKSKVICIDLNGVKSARIERQCLGIGLYLLDVTVPVFEDR